MIAGIDMGGSAEKTYIAYIEGKNIEIVNEKEIEGLENFIKKFFLIGVDAPFSVPAKLIGIEEEYEDFGCKLPKSLQNQYLYDNSARFVYKHTGITPLAPCASFIGYLTARMIKMQKENSFNFIKTPKFTFKDINLIEVYPAAFCKLFSKKYKTASKKEIIYFFIKKENLILKKEELNSDETDALLALFNALYVYKKGFLAEKEEKFRNSFIFLPDFV